VRGPGGKGDFYLRSIEGQSSQQATRQYLVIALNQFNNVILSQKYSYPEAVRTIAKKHNLFNIDCKP
jgi:hypothetical protein